MAMVVVRWGGVVSERGANGCGVRVVGLWRVGDGVVLVVVVRGGVVGRGWVFGVRLLVFGLGRVAVFGVRRRLFGLGHVAVVVCGDVGRVWVFGGWPVVG